MHIILDMIGVPNDSIQQSTGKVNTIDGPCNVLLLNNQCPETLFSSE